MEGTQEVPVLWHRRRVGVHPVPGSSSAVSEYYQVPWRYPGPCTLEASSTTRTLYPGGLQYIGYL